MNTLTVGQIDLPKKLNDKIIISIVNRNASDILLPKTNFVFPLSKSIWKTLSARCLLAEDPKFRIQVLVHQNACTMIIGGVNQRVDSFKCLNLSLFRCYNELLIINSRRDHQFQVVSCFISEFDMKFIFMMTNSGYRVSWYR